MIINSREKCSYERVVFQAVYDQIRIVLEVNLEGRVSTNDDLSNIFYAMSVKLVQLEGVLVREVPKASAASKQ